MYLFNRMAKFKGEHAAAGAAFAVEVAAVASKITGHPIAVFQAAFGAPLGTVMWTVRHQSHAELGDAMTKLLADPTYNQMVQANSHLFEGDIVDSFNTVVSSTLDATVRPFYALVLATAANGKMAEAVAFGVKAQAYVAKATGLPTAFSTNMYGAPSAPSRGSPAPTPWPTSTRSRRCRPPMPATTRSWRRPGRCSSPVRA